ncbi:MAG: hypothetical protein HQL08_01240 [Nitrospirae bacterium]|nr:hypothetical protein [Nitrospirota bacterium]
MLVFKKGNIGRAGILIAVFFMVTMFGCASAGNQSLRNETEVTVSQKVVEGKTTREEIRAMFGSPASTSFTDGGLEIWKYELANMHGDAVNYLPIVNLFGRSASGTKKELVVLYDATGIVKRCSMSESAVSVKTGVFR